MYRPLILAVLLLAALPDTARSHGAWIEWTAHGNEISIVASFDEGTPMAGASVTVYSGSDPSQPWLTGTVDSLGHFSFTPDRELSQKWDVQVRLAGHGDIVRIDLSGENSAGGTTALSPLQIVLMAACVVWGMIGTALFFMSRKGERRDAHS